MFDSATDPTGNALMRRASDFRRNYYWQHANDEGAMARPAESVAPDTNWDAFFQALHEAGVNKVADQSRLGGQGSALPTTVNPGYQSVAGAGFGPSRQINARPRTVRSVAGLNAAVGQ